MQNVYPITLLNVAAYEAKTQTMIQHASERLAATEIGV